MIATESELKTQHPMRGAENHEPGDNGSDASIPAATRELRKTLTGSGKVRGRVP